MSDSSRNPLLIPASKESSTLRGCPKCGERDFTGRNVQGMVTMTCTKCRNQWHGGLPQTAADPTVPAAPVDPADQPLVQFVRGPRGEILEQRRHASAQQEFRKGLPITEGEE